MSDIIYKIIESKKEFVSRIGKAESVRDFGGMWKVNGLYLLDAVQKLGSSYGSMVDKLHTSEFKKEADKLNARIEHVKIDFRELATAELEPTQVSMLNDVLLHQNNFTEVIRQATFLTEEYIVIQQPFYEGFSIPASCSLLQFMEKEWRDRLHNEMWIDSSDQTAFNVDIWMWAQSMGLFIDIMKGYGWGLVDSYSFPIENTWVYGGLLFKK